MIRFPKVSIATSVVNRILNVHEEIEAASVALPSVSQASTPPVPNSQAAGATLDQSLAAPVQPVGGEPELADALALKGVL